MTKPDQLSTEEKQAKEPQLSPEQAAILASATKVQSELTGQLEHDEHGNLIEPEAEAEKVDPVKENTDLLAMLVAMATPALPFLPQCYTPEVIGHIAGAYTAVEEKYGWNARGMIGPEFALALIALPPTITAYSLGKKHFAELRARREAEQARQSAKSGAQDARETAIGAN